MTTLQIANIFTTEQEVENFVLSYLETHQDFFSKIILPKFLPKKTRRRKLPMVDVETNERIGQALAEIKTGNYVLVSNPQELDNYLDSIFKA